MPKRQNLWDNSKFKQSYHFQSKKEKDLYKKIDEINYKIIELKCEIDCLVQKKAYYLKKITEI